MDAIAWLLAVVSSDGQSETLDFQEHWGREVAASNGWTIERVFKDVSSGKNGTRKLLRDLLGELRQLPKGSRPGRILLVRLDRLGRGDGLDVVATIAEIKRLGVGLFTRDDGDVKLEKASDNLLPMIKAVIAGIENETRADRTRAGHARRRARGLHHGNAPYGAIVVDGIAVAYEVEATLTRHIFELRTQGWGYDRLARLASQRALPKVLKGGKTRRFKWGRSTIERLLRCRTLRGVVVDEDLFDRVQAARGIAFKARRIQSWAYPLAHAVRCTCGTLLSGQCSGRDGYRARYLVCREVTAHSYYPHHNAERVEAQFLDLLRRLHADPNLVVNTDRVEALDGLRSRQTALRAELASNRERSRKAWELAEKGGIDAGALRARLDQLSQDERQYATELQTVETEIDRAAHAQTEARAVESSLRLLEGRWASAPLDLQQSAASAVAAIVGGLWLAPGERGRGRRRIISTLKTGLDLREECAATRHRIENMREIDTLRNVDMAQRKADDSITKKFIQSITE